jgi:DDE superfamily endonuclease
LTERGAQRVRKTFFEAKVNVVINCDETFIRFHEVSTKVLAKKGSKRVGVARKLDEKDGCTLMVSMEMKTSQLLPPFVIFKGGFCKTLMKKWKDYEHGTVLFTENHWQTEETMKIYVNHLRLTFPGKTIGLVFDCAPSHSRGLVQWINKENEESNTKVVVEYIDECLTSIYQPCDIMINKPLKSKVRSHYYKHVRGLNSKPGEKLVISRENLMNFIVLSYNEINNEQIYDRTIAESFNKCGLNPYSLDTDLKSFRRHLDSLNEVKAYDLLIEANHHEEFKASLESILN